MNASHLVVVGAGVAGLTLAHQLCRHGYRITIVERNHAVGGLGRSLHYRDFHFDIGPHRYHTDSPRVEAYIRQVLGSEAIDIRRTSGVRMFGRFHDWPLRPSVFLSMTPSVLLRGAWDLAVRPPMAGDSFEADVRNKYGRTLSEIFFRPYTKKFLFHDPSMLHRDWARAGVNRAIIDKRASADTIWSLLRTTLLPKPIETSFIYTPRGVGRFSERLAEEIAGAGGRLLLGQRVAGLETRGDRIVAVIAGAERIACDGVMWTGPLTEANRLLGLPEVDLGFLSTIFYNFEIAAPLAVPYQWTYFGGDEIFSRVSAPSAFAPSMAPEGMSGLCVEVTCREGDDRWRHPERLVPAVVADLVRTGTIAHQRSIVDLHIEPVPNTYPIYTLDYGAELSGCLRRLGRYRNLLLAGRCGRFWYNNMDHSIGQALTMADRILRGDVLSHIDEGDRAFWNEKADPGPPAIRTAPGRTASRPRLAGAPAGMNDADM